MYDDWGWLAVAGRGTFWLQKLFAEALRRSERPMRCGTAPDGSCWCSAGALSCLEGFTNVCRGFPLSFRPYCFVFVGLRGGTWGVDLTAPQRLCKQFLEPECASASQPQSCHHFLRILQQCFFFLLDVPRRVQNRKGFVRKLREPRSRQLPNLAQ